MRLTVQFQSKKRLCILSPTSYYSLLRKTTSQSHTPMAQQEEDPSLGNDNDGYFPTCFDADDGDDDKPDDDDLLPVSDDTYAQNLQFQETLMASLITSQNAPSSSSSPLLCMASSSNAVDGYIVSKEEGKSSSSSLITCDICVEVKRTNEMFRNQICDHSFCYDCVTKQVATKIKDRITVISCPGLDCKGNLEIDACRTMLPKDLIEKWDDALCEAFFSSVPKFYCPFRDCSAMLLDENNEGGDIRESECPFCHRLFCATCHVPWHPGVDCELFQTLNEDERGREDLLVRELANQKKWSRCPKCKFYVEKTEGCLHITCRCRHEFCYACGEQWTSTHGGCQRN